MYQQPPNNPSQPGFPSSPDWGGQQPYPNQPPYPGQQPPPPPYQQQLYDGPSPNWQPVPPPKKKSKLPLIIGIVVLVIAVIVCGSVVNAMSHLGSTNTGTTTNSSSSSSTTNTAPTATSAPVSQHFKIGQTVSVGNTWQITVDSAKTSSGTQFDKPQKAGNVFLIFIVSMKNITSQEQDVSSLVQWNLQDSTGQKYDETIYPDAGASLDGKVEAGSPLKGALVYEVPKSMKSFTLSFENDITSAGQTIWDITL